MIRLTGTVLVGLLGLAFGSFLNVCVSRWPRGMSVVRPRSYCEGCGRTLAWWENVPLVSWLALRGRCRTCGVWIGWRTVIVELAVGVTWAMFAWRLGSSLIDPRFGVASRYALPYFSVEYTLGMMAFSWALVGLAALDFEALWLPDFLTLSGIALGVLFYVTLSAQMGWFFVMESTLWKDLFQRLAASATSAVLILVIRWVYWLIRRREGIGLGDVKLMAMLAAWLGLSGALLAFGIGVVLGAVVAVAALALRAKEQNKESWAVLKLPLGTFLCIGGIVSGLWGQPIIVAYKKWAGF